MSAKLQLYKFTGKECEFGTPVSSIGLKRIDACVPAVYQDKDSNGVVIANDASDTNTYCIYKPDEGEEVAYSYESAFKLKLEVPPHNQLSNIRIYPEEIPNAQHKANLTIGCSTKYFRPTNTKSKIARNSIWNYTKDAPFLVTVGGVCGEHVINKEPTEIEFDVEYHNTGDRNELYVDNEKSPVLRCVEGVTYYFHNRTFVALEDGTVLSPCIPIRFWDAGTGNEIIVPQYGSNNSNIQHVIDGGQQRVVVFTPTSEFYNTHPHGILYGISLNNSAPIHSCKQWDMDWIDYGQGNVISLDKHPRLPIAFISNPTNPNEYRFYDRVDRPEEDEIDLAFFKDEIEIVSSEIEKRTLANGDRVSIITVNDAFVSASGKQFTYKRASLPNSGGVIRVISKDSDEINIIEHEVEVQETPTGEPMFYRIDGARTPVLNFEQGEVHKFINKSGDKYPLRFLNNPKVQIVANTKYISTEGVFVENGGTDEEVIWVYVDRTWATGKYIRGYQSTSCMALGGTVKNIPLRNWGMYNINTRNAGTFNPSRAGETDFIYIQLEVNDKTDVGNVIPTLRIEYDES